MPTVDERLHQLFSDAAVEPTANGDVLGRVARKRHQRATRRVARNVGAVVVVLLVLAGSLAWLTADGDTEPAGEYAALAAYNRDGTGFKVPSHVVRIDASGRVLDEVELQGEVLSLADGDGARWVVTHDADNVATRQYRV